MGLTALQKIIWQKSRALGSGDQAVALSDGACAFLLGTIAADLGLLNHFPECNATLPAFFGAEDLDTLVIEGVDAHGMFERLLSLRDDADMYYACLATLHKARLKYERILETQPLPTIDQVGPRGLLQYGKFTARALSGLLFWRKWFYDIDNRAAQETGYLFEPIIACSVGGTPAPAGKSPIKRHADGNKGRQVDCMLDKKAYELKLRVTIAASGQGRWKEEIDFPRDCRESGYVPVLVVLDATTNPKLVEMEMAFRRNGGEVYLGDAAWDHLEGLAGPVMSSFLEKYVRRPINALIQESSRPLPEFSAKLSDQCVTLTIAGETLVITRGGAPIDDEGQENRVIPDDISDELPG